MASRLKVLVSAYACNPNQGSEEGVGWGWVRTIARLHDVWVITDASHQEDIEAAVRQSPDDWRCVSFHYVPRTRWNLIEALWPPSFFWTYEHWQKDTFQLARQLHRDVGFDLAHQLTYVTFRVPGYLWKLDLPFVWGPLGALENTPWRFLPMLGLRGCLHFAARNLINSLHRRCLWRPKEAFHRASGGIIAATEGIQREIRRWYGEDSRVICEVGPPPRTAAAPSIRNDGEPLRLAWSGLHLPRKALPLLLHALNDLPDSVRWELDILGGGPCTAAWQRLAERLGLSSRCRWHGFIPREKAVGVIGKCHLVIITSMQDLTSTVVLEAISQGVPVVCPDHCGFAEVVTPESGVKLPLTSPRQLRHDLAHCIAQLAGDEPKRRRLAEGALRRIADYSWEKKSQMIDQIYQEVVASWQKRRQKTSSRE